LIYFSFPSRDKYLPGEVEKKTWDQSHFLSFQSFNDNPQNLPHQHHSFVKMEAAKRITTVIARSHGCVAARCIHYTPQCMATRSMASPKVARARKQPSNPAFIAPRQSDAEDLLPPVVMLDSARKSGVIDVDASAAHEFLRDYLRTMPTAQSGWERRLCDSWLLNMSNQR
jgi:hypothetical protein